MRNAAIALMLSIAGTAAGASESVWLEGEAASSFTFNRHGWYQDTTVDKRLMSPGRPEVSAGDWLAHYVPGSNSPATASWTVAVAEGGSYAWWIRTNPIQASLRWSVDVSPLQPVDLSDYREVVNIVQGTHPGHEFVARGHSGGDG